MRAYEVLNYYAVTELDTIIEGFNFAIKYQKFLKLHMDPAISI